MYGGVKAILLLSRCFHSSLCAAVAMDVY